MNLISKVINNLEWLRQPKNSSKLTTSTPLIHSKSVPNSGVTQRMSFHWHVSKSEPSPTMKRYHCHHVTRASTAVKKTSICVSRSKMVSLTNQTRITLCTGSSRTRKDSPDLKLQLHTKTFTVRTSANPSSIIGKISSSKSRRRSLERRSAALLRTKQLYLVWNASMAEVSSGAASPTSPITL